jgi:hypothetical protein
LIKRASHSWRSKPPDEPAQDRRNEGSSNFPRRGMWEWFPLPQHQMKTTMQIQVNIVVCDDSIHVKSPYAEHTISQFRSIGGKFDRDTREWVFPRSQAAQNMLSKLYGADSPVVIALVPYDKTANSGNSRHHGGYLLATRPGRDDYPVLAPGVHLEQGQFSSSGGSVKNPHVSGTDLVFAMACHSAYSAREGLDIFSNAEVEQPNPLAGYTVEELRAEVNRRKTKGKKKMSEVGVQS